MVDAAPQATAAAVVAPRLLVNIAPPRVTRRPIPPKKDLHIASNRFMFMDSDWVRR